MQFNLLLVIIFCFFVFLLFQSARQALIYLHSYVLFGMKFTQFNIFAMAKFLANIKCYSRFKIDTFSAFVSAIFLKKKYDHTFNISPGNSINTFSKMSIKLILILLMVKIGRFVCCSFLLCYSF